MKAMSCEYTFVNWYADQQVAAVVIFLQSVKDLGNNNIHNLHMTVAAGEFRAVACFKELKN